MHCRLAVLVLLLVGGPARAADPPEYRTRGDLAIKAREIFRKHCSACHTGSADPGQSKLKLMNHEQIISKKTPVPLAAPNGRSLILDLVKDGSMPPANRPGPTAEEIAVLEAWVNAKAPAYPLVFDDTYVLTAVVEDMERTEKKGFGVNFDRYVSFAHLIRDDGRLPDLAAAEHALQAALAGTTTTAVNFTLKLEPIDAVGTVYRLNLIPAGWERLLFTRTETGKDVGDATFRPFDAILLEYPYAIRLPAADPLRVRLDQLFSRPNQGRPIAFVRGDWLTRVLSDGTSPSTLAAELNALTALDRVLRKGEKAPDGPVARAFANAKPVIVPAAANGREPIPPLSAWYCGDVTPEKAPFDLKAELVADGKPVTKVTVDESFHLRVTCDKQVFITLLMVQADGEIVVQEVQGGTVLLPNQERKLAPKETGFVISGIVTGGDSAVEHLVLFASESALPLPTVIHSKHRDKQIWRFLMEPTEQSRFDPNAVVRKVIPIRVSRK